MCLAALKLNRVGWRALVAIASVLYGGIACSTSGGELVSPHGGDLSLAHRLGESTSKGGVPRPPEALIVSISDGDGRTITVDEFTQTIQIETGEWLSLDRDLMDLVLAEIRGSHVVDTVWQGLYAAAQAWDPYENCGSGGICEELRGENPGGSGQRGTMRWRSPDYGSSPPWLLPTPARPPMRPGRSNALPLESDERVLAAIVIGDGPPTSSPNPVWRSVPGVLAELNADPCLQARLNILLSNWPQRRYTMIGEMYQWLKGHVFELGLGAFVPKHAVAGLVLAEIGGRHTLERTGVLVLSALWNASACGSSQPLQGRAIIRNISGGAGAWVDHCWYEQWEVSFDGGFTWFPFWLERCERRRPNEEEFRQ